MKKKYLYLTMGLLILMILGGCSGGGGEEIPTPTPTPKPETNKVTLTVTSFSANPEGGTFTTSLTSNTDWTATSDQSWCTLSSASGTKGTYTLIITVNENSTTESRNATITIKAGTASQKITLSQDTYEVTISSKEFAVEPEASTFTMTVKSNTNWTLTSDQPWCTFSIPSGGKGTFSLTVNVDENTQYEERTATITAKAGAASQTATINQKAAELLHVEKDTYDIAAEGGTLDIAIQTNVEYTLSATENWIRESGRTDGKLMLTIDANNVEAERSVTVTLKGKRTEVSFTVTQTGIKLANGEVDDMPNEKW